MTIEGTRCVPLCGASVAYGERARWWHHQPQCPAREDKASQPTDQPWGDPGHCYDIDGDWWHTPGECKDHGERCCGPIGHLDSKRNP